VAFGTIPLQGIEGTIAEEDSMREALRTNALGRLRRLEGQVRGIARMVEEDAYCIDVLTQLQAISAACDSLGLLLLDDHVRTCVADAVRAGEGSEKLDELTASLRRFARR
jgi:CsoR family transcriptional regulator, copper-sensing transcriptional repressor